MQVAHAGRFGIVGIVGEHVEQGPPEDLLPPRHGGAQVGVADRDDREIRSEHEIESGRGLEQRSEVRLRHAWPLRRVL